MESTVGNKDSKSTPRPGLFLYQANFKSSISIGISETSTHLQLQLPIFFSNSHLTACYFIFFKQLQLTSQEPGFIAQGPQVAIYPRKGHIHHHEGFFKKTSALAMLSPFSEFPCI